MSIPEIAVLLEKAVQLNASDLHISVGVPPVVRIDGQLKRLNYDVLKPDDTKAYITYILDNEKLIELQNKGDIDLSYSIQGLSRFRINIYKQRGSYSLAIRIVNRNIPTMESLGLPSVIKKLAVEAKGLVLITGPTGSGKTTTLASMIDYINNNQSKHIITLEDPIEYLHRNNKSIVNQREIHNDALNFNRGLRAALRQDPDVILVGEMRDLETISTALTAAETGHLVLSTLHTIGAVKTIDRIIDVFPPSSQQQIRVQLSMVLKGVVSQQLIPLRDGKGRILAPETMVVTPAIRNMIRESKVHQIANSIQTGGKYGMKTMDSQLAELYLKGMISKEDAINHSSELDVLLRLIGE
ncbi:MAG: type IV pilus twitching motility protein PilT [Clostridia bacterium]|nr:type IV pilus twitching motility protein PilT [Clostridia bacterium]